MKKKIIIITILSLFFSSVIGTASWYTNIKQDFKPELSPSGLTEHLVNLTGDSYIYDNGKTATGYTAISSDPTWDANERTINLGYVNKEITIKGNAYFTHADEKIVYSETEYKDEKKFTTDKDENDYSEWINGAYQKVNNRLYTIKLVGDVVLDGTLSIGALVGRKYSSGFNGPIIQGNFVTLDLNGHTLTINEGATLNAYGYIIDTALDEDGKHIGKIDNYGTIYSSFIVENYTGGGQTVATAAFGTVPFTIYSIPYLSCKTVFYDTSSLKCPASLFTSSISLGITKIGGLGKDVIDLISYKFDANTIPLIKINSGAYVIKDSYNNPSQLSTAALYGSNYRTDYVLNGNIDIKTLKMTINVSTASKIINSAEFGLILPPYVNINIESGTTSVGMLVDFLPGSTLFVNTNAIIDFTTYTIDKDYTLSQKNEIIVDGGIRMLSLLTAESSTCYGGVINGAGNSAYNEYLKDESLINKAGNDEARAIINGNISIDKTNDKHVIGGKINLSNYAKTFVEANSDKFNIYAKTYDYYAYISGTDLISAAILPSNQIKSIKEKAVNQVCASYSILPLVSYGKVVNPQSISSYLSDDTTYDFSEGVFFSNNKTYAFMPLEESTIANYESDGISGEIVTVTHYSDKHLIEYNEKTYSFYRNMFVENLTSNSINDSNLYVYDNYYGQNISSMKYYPIDINNDTVTYTYKNKIITTNKTVSGTFSREKYYYKAFGKEYSISYGNYEPNEYNESEAITSSPSSIDEYVTDKVNTNNYNFYYSSGNKNSYTNDFEQSLNLRTIANNRFTISTEDNYYKTDKYNQIGSLILINNDITLDLTSWTIVEGSESNIVNVGNPTSSLGKYTQKQSGECMLEQKIIQTISEFKISSPLYFYSTCVKWNSTTGMWVKF